MSVVTLFYVILTMTVISTLFWIICFRFYLQMPEDTDIQRRCKQDALIRLWASAAWPVIGVAGLVVGFSGGAS